MRENLAAVCQDCDQNKAVLEWEGAKYYKIILAPSQMANRTPAEIFQKRLYAGSFKPSRVMAESIGTGSNRDFLSFQGLNRISDVTYARMKQRLSEHPGNVILVDVYPTHKWTGDSYTIAITALPGHYNVTDPEFSVDSRPLHPMGLVGMAHSSLEAHLDPKEFTECVGPLIEEKSRVIDLLGALVLRFRDKPIDLDAAYRLRGDPPYTVEITSFRK